MRFIAFDVALRKTGVAYPNSIRGWNTEVISVHDTTKLDLVIAWAKETHDCVAAAIEDCWLGKNAASFKALAISQGRIVSACERAGLVRIEIVHPSTWQNNYGISAKNGGDVKLGAMRVAKLLGYGGDSQDEADAICLCDYAQQMWGK